jgi:hypothetical protein
MKAGEAFNVASNNRMLEVYRLVLKSAKAGYFSCRIPHKLRDKDIEYLRSFCGYEITESTSSKGIELGSLLISWEKGGEV